MSMDPREFVDPSGHRWAAAVVSHGRTSAYLNPRVHRPIVEFRCLDQAQPRRYGRLPVGRDSLEGLEEGELAALLARARAH
jgi:hypothetical protein